MKYDDYLTMLHHMEINHKEELMKITPEKMDEIIRTAASNMARENLSIGESREFIEKLVEKESKDN